MSILASKTVGTTNDIKIIHIDVSAEMCQNEWRLMVESPSKILKNLFSFFLFFYIRPFILNRRMGALIHLFFILIPMMIFYQSQKKYTILKHVVNKFGGNNQFGFENLILFHSIQLILLRAANG